MSTRITQGDCIEELRKIEDCSVHCCVTSPPYWGLRDYGHAGQIGLESTPQEYVEKMIAVFREVWRVLRDDGTLWLNLGDSYCSTAPGTMGDKLNQRGILAGVSDRRAEGSRKPRADTPNGLKPKDLVGIPWRVAFALQADGWYLRQDIIWAKPNPMPESVRDRCTKAHEYLFLLAKSERYYYDADAIAEPAVADHPPGNNSHKGATAYENEDGEFHRTKSGLVAYAQRQRDVGIGQNARPSKAVPNDAVSQTRNKRDVWTVSTQPYAEAHFATFPPALIEPCILAGCPEGGTVLDPFGGAGTTGLVADRLQRSAILIEINPEYAQMARSRIHSDAPLFAEVSA